METTNSPADTTETYTDELKADTARRNRMVGKTWPTTVAEDIAFDPEAMSL